MILADAPTLNQSIVLVYWLDSLNLKTNQTVTDYSVKLTLLRYIPYVNQKTDTAAVEVAQSQLLNLSRSIEIFWSQSKQSSGTFVVDIYRNSTASTAVVAALVIISAAALLSKWLLLRAAAKKKIAALSTFDKDFFLKLQTGQLRVDNPSPDYLNYVDEKIEGLRKQHIIREKMSLRNGEVYREWVPY